MHFPKCDVTAKTKAVYAVLDSQNVLVCSLCEHSIEREATKARLKMDANLSSSKICDLISVTDRSCFLSPVSALFYAWERDIFVTTVRQEIASKTSPIILSIFKVHYECNYFLDHLIDGNLSLSPL